MLEELSCVAVPGSSGAASFILGAPSGYRQKHTADHGSIITVQSTDSERRIDN